MIACFLSNISAKYYKNPSMFFRVIAKNVGDVFFETQCILERATAVVEVRPIGPLSVKKCGKKTVFGNIRFMVIFKEITENKCVDKRHPFVKGVNVTNSARCATTGKRCEIGLS